MVDPWLEDPAARAVVDEVCHVVGRDVTAWWRDPANDTDLVAAQLEVVVTGVAGYRSLTAAGMAPVAVAGHGVGEYAALVAAGALALDQVVELVHWRAELLALAPRPSCAGMAAVIGPGAGDVARTAIARIGSTGPLAVASVDSPEQVVLCGDREQLALVRDLVLKAGLDLVRLPGRVACHGPLMQPVAAHLSAALSDLAWSVPVVPVVPNVDARASRDPGHLADTLRAHLTSPVQWQATSHALVDVGASAVVEVGTAPILGRLILQVHPDLPVHLVTGPRDGFPIHRPQPVLASPVPT
jgi:[acyl-carrier-protein] S-malonyltransferase